MSDPRHSVLTLYHDIPFDPDYNHTVLFPDVACQNMWFQTKVLATNIPYTTMSYLRHTRGVIRIQSKMNLLTNCNYISFYNPETVDTNTVLGYEDVKFYAFVDNIDYINENTVEISYTIDQIQTWMFYYLLNPCYVEREHVRSDLIGEHRVKEGIDTGDYVVSGFESIDFWGWEQTGRYDVTNTGFVVLATQPIDGGTPNPKVINGIVSGLTVYTCVNSTEFNELLMEYKNGPTGNFDPIIAVYQIPGNYLNSSYSGIKDYNVFTLSQDYALGMTGFRNWSAAREDEDLYVPLNNKLYTYPYNFLVLEAPDGSSQQLKYENFQHLPSYADHLGFIVYLSVFPEPETMCVPLNYESTQFMANLRTALCSKAYPTVPLASNAFQAWWAQNRYNMPIVDASVEGVISPQNLAGLAGQNSVGGMKDVLSAFKDAVSEIVNTPSSRMQIGGRMMKMTAEGLSTQKPVSGSFSELGGLFEEVGRQLAAVEGHKAIPNTVATKANNGGVTHATHTDCYKVFYTQIRPEYARIIDRYFSTYGYAIQYVKQPDIESRVVWNYIKTVGCTIRPNAAFNRSVPMEAERLITKIYDRGITFWHWPELIHQYVHSYGTDDEPKMYNPIGRPYNFPGMPGYLPNPDTEPWTPPSPEPTPTPTPPVTGTKIYMQCDAGWTQPYIVGFPVQGDSYYIVPMTSEGDNVWSCDASLFNQDLQAVPPRPHSYYIMVFVNGNTASTWNSYSNYYNIEATDNIIQLYDMPTNDPIGAFYVGLSNPFTGSPVVPTVPTIYFQYYTSANNMYVLNMGTMETLPMAAVTASDSQERVWSIPLSEIESWAAFAFSTTSVYDASHPENVSQVLYKTTTPSPQQVYSGTSEYMGNYYIGTSNPFRSNSEDKIYMQFVTDQSHMYVMTTDGGQVITKPMTRVQGINVQDRVWVIDLSEVSSWTQMIFTTETTFQAAYASEAIDKTRTESPRQFMNWNQNVYLGNYYVGPNNPFIS